MPQRRLTGIMILGALALAAPAGALEPREVLKYEYTMAWIEPISASTPDLVLKKGGVAPMPMSMSMSFTVATDRIEDDGSVHAMIRNSFKGFSPRGWSLNEPFEGNVLSDGEIVPKYDLAMIKASGLDQNNSTVTRGYHPRTHEESVNFAAFSFTRQLAIFNDLALGAAKKTSFNDGDTWRVSIADKDEVVNFTYQGMQSYHGHEVLGIGFTTTRITQNGVVPVTGNFLYDRQRHMVASVHSVGEEDMPSFGGVRNTTVDITLQ